MGRESGSRLKSYSVRQIVVKVEMYTRIYNGNEKYLVLNLMYDGNGIHCIVNLVPLPEGRLMIRGRHVLIRSIAC
jgi:hypothetical protein